MNEKMLQRQIMFKQLQELQRRQQLQELSNTRNQNYLNQLSSLKHASGGLFSPTVNGTPIQDPSGLYTVGNVQMMQHGGPNGLFLSQSPVGLSQPQLDISLYGSHIPNPDKNLNQYSHLQGPSSLSVNLRTKNNSSPLGMATMQPSAFGSSFMSQQCNFSSDQMSVPDGTVVSNQEKDSFGQAPVEGFHSGILSGNFSQQGITMQGNSSLLKSEGRHEDTCSGGLSPGKTSKLGLSITADSLDPLEQKILYNTDDNGWESSVSRSSKMSWSALMQSALEETSGSDPGMQEEWSGLSFQNPGPSNDNQPLNFIDNKEPQNNWADRNLRNASAQSSKPEHLFQNFSMNGSYTNFQQSGYQYQQQKEEYQCEPSHATTQNSPRNTSQLADYDSQQKRHTEGSHMIQTSLASPNIWPGQHKEHMHNDANQPGLLSRSNDNQPSNFSGQEFKGTFWLEGNTSHHVPGGIQKPYDQVNQLNIHGHSAEPENMDPGKNVKAVSTDLGASLECPGENVTVPSESMLELLNKDDISNNQTHFSSEVSTPGELPETSVPSFAKPCKTSFLTPDFGSSLRPADPRTPQSHSFLPSLSTGTSGATSLSTHNVSNHIENQYPAPPVPGHMATEFSAFSVAASQDNSKLRIAHSIGPEALLLESVPATQPSSTSYMSQRVGFQMGLPTQWPDMAVQRDMSSPKPNKFASLFLSPDSASRRWQTSSAAPSEQHSQNSFQGKSEWGEQQLDEGSSAHEGSTEINRPTPPSSRKHHMEVDAVGSGSLMTNMPQQASIQAEEKEKETHSFPAADIGAFSHSTSQNYSVLHVGKSYPPKYDRGNFQQLISRNSWQDGQGDQAGKVLSTSYHLNQQKGMFCQNDIPSRSVGSSETSNLACQSQINLPTAPSWFKRYGPMNNGQILPTYDPIAAVHATQSFSEVTLGNLQEGSLIRQASLASAGQGSGLHPSAAATSMTCKQLNPTSMLPSGAAYPTYAISLPKKRKLVALDVVPWHKEINQEQSLLRDISMAELSWAQASNRREEEVKCEAEIVDELLPVIQRKRRLTCTTQLMQQVFRPAPSVILCSDASSNCDCIAYYAARLALGDACSLTGQLPSESSDVSRSSDKLKTSKRTNACKFSEVVGGFINRVKNLEDDLTRLDKSLSFVDIKVEIQELEKFSTINRFAKFHIKAHPSTADPASSSTTSTLSKSHPQRYVVGYPMPKVVPEATECLSL